MKLFWLKICGLLPVFGLIILFNQLALPYHMNDTEKYSYTVAGYLLAGKNVTNLWQPDDAAIVTRYIEGLNAKKEILVFGSSRSRLIRSDFFSSNSFFNNSISGGGLRDYIALYDLYAQKGLLPSTVILEISPWVFSTDYHSRWTSLNARSDEILNSSVGLLNLALPKPITDQFSLGYFQISFYKQLLDWTSPVPLAQSSAIFPWNEGRLVNGETLQADGSVVYFRDHFHYDENRKLITAAAVEYANRPAPIPPEISPEAQKNFAWLIEKLKAAQTRVILYLPPYHPEAYRLLLQSPIYQSLAPMEEYVQRFAREQQVQVIGSYDPARIAMDQDSFFDGSHLTEEAIQKIFTAALPDELKNKAGEGPARIKFTYISNPNGVEISENRPFFWIGKDTTCLEVSSPAAGYGVLSFNGTAGPSFPATPVRRLLLTNQANRYQQELSITQYPDIRLVFPVTAGFNFVCLKPLDTPMVLEANRPLLLGVRDPEINFSATP